MVFHGLKPVDRHHSSNK